jgi:hypothetical protein
MFRWLPGETQSSPDPVDERGRNSYLEAPKNLAMQSMRREGRFLESPILSGAGACRVCTQTWRMV